MNWLPRWKDTLVRLSKRLSRVGLYEFLEEQYGRIPKNASVLSIGAGGEVNRLLMLHARRASFVVTTFDIDPERVPDIVGDLCGYEFGDMRFDVVVMSEVLEHLHSPGAGLDTVEKILNPEGVLILTTPFILPIHDRPFDYYRFTRFGLAHLLKRFDDVEIRERNSYFEAMDVLWVRILFTRAERSLLLASFLIPVVFFVKRPISKLLGKIVSTDAMTTGYVVHARKGGKVSPNRGVYIEDRTSDG